MTGFDDTLGRPALFSREIEETWTVEGSRKELGEGNQRRGRRGNCNQDVKSREKNLNFRGLEFTVQITQPVD